MTRIHLALVAALALVSLAGCSGGSGKAKYPQPSTLPTAQDVIARLEQARAARTSFRVETLMDYWLGKERAKGTVFVMGTSKRQVRFAALRPDGNTLVDMACDGTSFTYVDFQNNCQLAGACNKQSIATLLRVELEPDDFHDLAQGTPPVLANATGTVRWNGANGTLEVALEAPGGKQSITIDARDNRFDVLASEQVDPAGKVLWSVENTGFHEIKDEAGTAHRVPKKTRFKSPTQGADLLVEWKDDARAINLPLAPAKFSVPIPPGLPACGSQPRATSSGAGASSPKISGTLGNRAEIH